MLECRFERGEFRSGTHLRVCVRVRACVLPVRVIYIAAVFLPLRNVPFRFTAGCESMKACFVGESVAKRKHNKI